MGDGIQQSPFQGLSCQQNLSMFRLLRQLNPFHGQRDLGGKSIEEAAVVRGAVIGFFGQLDGQNPEKTRRGMEGQVEELGGTERFRADPGHLVVAKGPVRHRRFLLVEHQILADCRGVHLLPVRDENRQFCLQGFADIFNHRRHYRFHVNGRREIAT